VEIPNMRRKSFSETTYSFVPAVMCYSQSVKASRKSTPPTLENWDNVYKPFFKKTIKGYKSKRPTASQIIKKKRGYKSKKKKKKGFRGWGGGRAGETPSERTSTSDFLMGDGGNRPTWWYSTKLQPVRVYLNPTKHRILQV